MNSCNDAGSDEDDPIVKEIPIIHSKKLEKSLYLFQFPLKRKMCKNELSIKKCFFKPMNQEVKLEMNINMESPNFDMERAKNIAQEMDGEGDIPKNQRHFENRLVDKVFLHSSVANKDPTKYAAAVYNGKEIHLTSLQGTFQLRPTFPHMDKGFKKKKGADDVVKEEAGSAQQVTVKFKSNDERWKKIQDASYQSLKAKSESEPWIECEWSERDSTLSSIERLQLVSDNNSDIRQAENLSDPEYVKLLVPEDQEEEFAEPISLNVVSLRTLKKLPLVEQCRHLLKRVRITQFQELLEALNHGSGGKKVTAEALLKVLPTVAGLVKGNWVIKSDILYPQDTFSAVHGVPAEFMCRARDYVVYLFTKNTYVERKKVSDLIKIPPDEMKEIFLGVAKLCQPRREWELKADVDQDFIDKHRDLVQRQNLAWEHRFHQINEFLKGNRGGQRRKSRSESKSVGDDGRARNGLSFSSDNDSGAEKNKSPVVGRKKRAK